VCIPDRPLSGSAMEKGHRAAQVREHSDHSISSTSVAGE
jgi:hypothetical protein